MKLQGTSVDFINAYHQVDTVSEVYTQISNNIDEDFHKVYEAAVDLAATVGVEPFKPRLCGRQCHRTNAGSGD